MDIQRFALNRELSFPGSLEEDWHAATSAVCIALSRNSIWGTAHFNGTENMPREWELCTANPEKNIPHEILRSEFYRAVHENMPVLEYDYEKGRAAYVLTATGKKQVAAVKSFGEICEKPFENVRGLGIDIIIAPDGEVTAPASVRLSGEPHLVEEARKILGAYFSTRIYDIIL